ncbi:MAG: hypothetical protein Q9183_006415, partial [Haloplaca sp. 2 TL-2023]
MGSRAFHEIKWSSQFSVLSSFQTPSLRGDRIILPQSALEQLLSAATVTVSRAYGPQTSSFDSFNPYSYAAEQKARSHLSEKQQELPHPLTFRLVNPANGRVCYAGIREFSAEEDCIGLSSFLRHSLGLDDSKDESRSGHLPNGVAAFESLEKTSQSKLTVHFEGIPKGNYVRLRPLEAGYDFDDWKSLLEKHLRENFTTLTRGEILTVVSGREDYRFLIDDLKPNDNAISIIDTDLEVDIEALNEEQARETLKQRVARSQKAPGSAGESSVGGLLQVESDVVDQVKPGDYVDYTLEDWDKTKDLSIECGARDDAYDVDLFLTPMRSDQRARPSEDEYVFADFSSSASKRLKIRHTNSALDDAEALWIS